MASTNPENEIKTPVTGVNFVDGPDNPLLGLDLGTGNDWAGMSVTSGELVTPVVLPVKSLEDAVKDFNAVQEELKVLYFKRDQSNQTYNDLCVAVLQAENAVERAKKILLNAATASTT